MLLTRGQITSGQVLETGHLSVLDRQRLRHHLALWRGGGGFKRHIYPDGRARSHPTASVPPAQGPCSLRTRLPGCPARARRCRETWGCGAWVGTCSTEVARALGQAPRKRGKEDRGKQLRRGWSREGEWPPHPLQPFEPVAPPCSHDLVQRGNGSTCECTVFDKWPLMACETRLMASCYQCDLTLKCMDSLPHNSGSGVRVLQREKELVHVGSSLGLSWGLRTCCLLIIQRARESHFFTDEEPQIK